MASASASDGVGPQNERANYAGFAGQGQLPGEPVFRPPRMDRVKVHDEPGNPARGGGLNFRGGVVIYFPRSGH